MPLGGTVSCRGRIRHSQNAAYLGGSGEITGKDLRGASHGISRPEVGVGEGQRFRLVNLTNQRTTARTGSVSTLICNVVTAVAILAAPPVGSAQDADPPPPDVPRAWSAAVGGGLSLTSGNTDSLAYNLAFDIAHNNHTGNVAKWTGLYLRGTQNDIVVVNRLSLGIRDEFTFSPRVFVFGQIDYLHDTFKRIDYFVSPAVGLGYKVIETPASQFSIDLGGGSVSERNPGSAPKTTGAIHAGETLRLDVTATASIKHAIKALWNTNDFANSLITSSIGIATRISSRFQLSVDVIDNFKTRPPTAETEKNDINLVVAITAKY
jgi:putative salt-induced outer membrane protein YdiY